MKLHQQDQEIKIQAIELKQKIIIQEAKLDEQNQKQNQTFEQLKISVTNNTFTNQLFYNSYTWKVNGFNRKFQRAKCYRDYDLQERSFFTSKGYLITVELCLTCDGADWNKEMWIFFRVEHGPFNDTLKWPMKAVFSVSLIGNGNVSEELTLDTKDYPRDGYKYLHKPDIFTGNESYGNSLIQVNDCQKYCVNDSITLIIKIDHY